MKVALFDIDGTIVTKTTTSPTAKQRAYTQAINEIYGIPDLNYMDYAIFGLTDRGILQLLLRENGLSSQEIQEGETDFLKAVIQLHSEFSKEYPQQYGPLPGAAKLLGTLREKGIKLGLATGNLEELGWFKLEEAHLDEYFTFGGFAEAGADRADIVREAMTLSGVSNSEEIVLLGDTYHDIDAARRNSIHDRAVATGNFTYEELVRYTGDKSRVLHNLSDTEKAVNCLLN